MLKLKNFAVCHALLMVYRGTCQASLSQCISVTSARRDLHWNNARCQCHCKETPRRYFSVLLTSVPGRKWKFQVSFNYWICGSVLCLLWNIRIDDWVYWQAVGKNSYCKAIRECCRYYLCLKLSFLDLHWCRNCKITSLVSLVSLQNLRFPP